MIVFTFNWIWLRGISSFWFWFWFECNIFWHLLKEQNWIKFDWTHTYIWCDIEDIPSFTHALFLCSKNPITNVDTMCILFFLFFPFAVKVYAMCFFYPVLFGSGIFSLLYYYRQTYSNPILWQKFELSGCVCVCVVCAITAKYTVHTYTTQKVRF